MGIVVRVAEGLSQMMDGRYKKEAEEDILVEDIITQIEDTTEEEEEEGEWEEGDMQDKIEPIAHHLT